MGALLDLLSINAGNTLFHTEEYMRYIDTHYNFLKENGSVVVDIDPGLAFKFEYNFFSLLVELKYNFEDFVVFLVMNQMRNPMEMTRDFKSLVVPNPEVLSNLKTLYRHQNKRV
jgi:hypothetical protein